MYQRARTKDQIDERKESILKAMDTIYLTKEYQNIYLKDVADLTSISRTALYSYYKSKEEILLASLLHHFMTLDDELEKLSEKEINEETLIDSLTSLFVENAIVLKIMSSNLNDIERLTSFEKIVELKTEIKRFQSVITKLLSIVFPSATKENIRYALYLLITAMHGFYPITNPIEIQKKAMEITNTTLDTDLPNLISHCLRFIFKNLK